MSNKNFPAFHIAFPVSDLEETRKFYSEVLGAREGRSTDNWFDFDLYGHQLSAHLHPSIIHDPTTSTVDGIDVPLHHWGIILDWNEFDTLANRITANGTEFIIPPTLRYPGKAGEQRTMFLKDPSGNALEFKAFRNPDEVFSHQE